MIPRLAGYWLTALIVMRSLAGSRRAEQPPAARSRSQPYHRRGRSAALVAALYCLLLFVWFSLVPRVSVGALGVGLLAVAGVLAAPELLAVPFSQLTPASLARLRTLYGRTRAALVAVGIAMVAIPFVPSPSGPGRLWGSEAMLQLGIALLVALVLVGLVVALARWSLGSILDEDLDTLTDRFFESGNVWIVAGFLFAMGTGLEFVAARG